VPIYTEISNALRNQIREGQYPPGTRLPPDRELHKRFDVSRLTMIRALEELAREGLVVRKRGSGTFVADGSEAPFIVGKAVKLGVLWNESFFADTFRSGFTARINAGVLKELGIHQAPAITHTKDTEVSRAVFKKKQRGVDVVCLGEPDWSHTRRPTMQSVIQERFDGLISLGITHDDWLDELLRLGIPTVLVDYPGRRFGHRADRVFVDPQTGYGEAVDHIIGQDLRNIHFVGQLLWDPAPTERMSWREWQRYRLGREHVNADSLLRLSAVRQALAEANRGLPEHCVHYVHERHNVLEDLTGKLLSLPRSRRPEAFLCHDAGTAGRLVRLFAEQDVTVTGIGATTPGARLPENTYAVTVSHEELGVVAADILKRRLERPGSRFLSVGIDTEFRGPETGREGDRSGPPQHGG
jgi:DNA-binding LacI/PurR family transcriptional regulator